MTKEKTARFIVIGILLSCATLPALVALSGRPASRVASATELAAAPVQAVRVITLDEITITASAPRVVRAPRRAARELSQARVVTLDQGGRPGHRTVVAWGL